MNLLYNSNLKPFSQRLRKSGNLSEVLVWNKLKKKQLLNLKFQRQKIIGNYIVDFYCTELNLVIEIDGVSHDYKQEYDFRREKYLKSLKLNIMHLEDKKIKQDLDQQMESVYSYCLGLRNTPSPTVPPL